ncbi:retrovirus-related pol polyprotein from transposon TNT 1-94 [Tanacetum coccineum]
MSARQPIVLRPLFNPYHGQVKKPKKVWSIERLASSKPSKPRSCLRWSPTGKNFDLKGKIIASSESESQYDYSKSDNACISNPQEPTRKQFPNSTFSLAGHLNLFMVRRLGMLKAHDRKSEASHKFRLEVLGNRKRKNTSRPPKPVPNSKKRLHLLHMDLCGPMKVESVNVLLQAPVIIVRTDNGTEFKNQVLKKYFYSVGISHQASSVRAPQQNGVVERRNRMLVEAARTMLIFSHAPLFLWAENNHEDIWKLVTKGDIGFFIGYSANSYAYKVYNRRTRKITKTMNMTLDKLLGTAFEQRSSKPGLQSMTSRQISSGLDRTYAPSTITTQQPTEHELNLLLLLQELIKSMQEELLQFKRLDVWVLVPHSDNIKPLTLKWLFKNKLDEENTVIRNKTLLVMRGYRQVEGMDFEES